MEGSRPHGRIQRGYTTRMWYIVRFLWNATRGHRLVPWRSPYIKWRLETYTGLKMEKIGFVQIAGIMWHEYRQMWRFLLWTAKMDNYARVKPHNPSTQDWG
ncbi:MAG: hypothetical protein ABSD13_01010 [Candidatus Korobacteraceae bacterium]